MPTEAKSSKGITKTRDLRENSLVYWRSIINYSNALEHLSAVSCRFNKLNMLIYTTKMINGNIFHKTLKETSIPATERSGGVIAEYISVVISLMRTAVKNIDTIESILQVIHQDNLHFMTITDTSIHDSDSSSNTTSNSGINWQVAEREERIKEGVNEVITKLNKQYQNRYVSSVWESEAFSDKN